MNAKTVLHDADYPALKRYVLEQTGLAYYADKDSDFAVRISRRLASRGVNGAAAYLNLLTRDSVEMDCLVGELTIGETFFFRQSDQFELLKSSIVPALMERNRATKNLRIWCAGCANGAEPYSVALLLDLEFKSALAGWDVSILATDINVEFIGQAREASYGEWTLRETPPDIRARCFRREGKRWTLAPEFRRSVTFRYHNLAGCAPPTPDSLPFDLILCRNVLIYFSREAMREVAARMHELLVPEGWLMVGHAEPNSEIFAQFEAITKPACAAYRKAIQRGAADLDWIPSTGSVYKPSGRSVIQPAVEFSRPAAPPRPAQLVPAPLPPEPLDVDDIRLLADSGRWKTALAEVDKFVRTHPLDAPAQFTRGLILQQTGAHEDARMALRRAIYLDRSFALAHYHLGASLQGAGEADSARRSFATVVRLLVGVSPAQPIPHGDGITAEELSDLAKMHLELIPE